MFLYRYQTRPTVLAIDRDYTNWNITFPSLTFCFDKKINETALSMYISRRKPKNPQLMDAFFRSLVNLTEENLWSLPNCTEISPEEYSDVCLSFLEIGFVGVMAGTF